MIQVVHPGSRIRMLTFSHPGSRIQGSKKYSIPDPGSGSATLCNMYREDDFMFHDRLMTVWWHLNFGTFKCFLMSSLVITRFDLSGNLQNSPEFRSVSLRMITNLDLGDLNQGTHCPLSWLLNFRGKWNEVRKNDRGKDKQGQFVMHCKKTYFKK